MIKITLEYEDSFVSELKDAYAELFPIPQTEDINQETGEIVKAPLHSKSEWFLKKVKDEIERVHFIGRKSLKQKQEVDSTVKQSVTIDIVKNYGKA